MGVFPLRGLGNKRSGHFGIWPTSYYPASNAQGVSPEARSTMDRALAMAIAPLLQHPESRPLDARVFVAKLRRQGWSPTYDQKLDSVEILIAGRSADPVHLLGNGIVAFEAVPAAIYAFTNARDSFVTVMTTAINLGGDTDTIAAMAGALAGAYLGEKEIPEPWRERVEGAVHLRQLADELLALALDFGHRASANQG